MSVRQCWCIYTVRLKTSWTCLIPCHDNGVKQLIGERNIMKLADDRYEWSIIVFEVYSNQKASVKNLISSSLWAPMQFTCIPNSLCCVSNKMNQGCKCIALEAREGAIIVPQQGSVCEFFSSLPCFCTYSGPSLLETRFSSETFSPHIYTRTLSTWLASYPGIPPPK